MNTIVIEIAGEIVGNIDRSATDMPMVIGVFIPTLAFEKYKALFDLEYEYLKAKDFSKRASVMDEIFRKGVRIMDTSTGRSIVGFPYGVEGFGQRGTLGYLHISGDRAWWRPF